MRLRHLFWPALAITLAILAWSSAVSAEAEQERTATGRPAYPGSLESAIERRRDMLDRRREHYLDWRTGRRWYQPPWVNAQDDRMNARQDAMRDVFRRRRDAMDTWQDHVGRWWDPWSQWREDWDDARRNALELDRLARDEYVDRFRYGRAWGPWGFPY